MLIQTRKAQDMLLNSFLLAVGGEMREIIGHGRGLRPRSIRHFEWESRPNENCGVGGGEKRERLPPRSTVVSLAPSLSLWCIMVSCGGGGCIHDVRLACLRSAVHTEGNISQNHATYRLNFTQPIT